MMIERLDHNSRMALKAAVVAIYFNDGSDFHAALYSVVSELTGLEDPSEEDVKAMYGRLHMEPSEQIKTTICKALSKAVSLLQSTNDDWSEIPEIKEGVEALKSANYY